MVRKVANNISLKLHCLSKTSGDMGSAKFIPPPFQPALLHALLTPCQSDAHRQSFFFFSVQGYFIQKLHNHVALSPQEAISYGGILPNLWNRTICNVQKIQLNLP